MQTNVTYRVYLLIDGEWRAMRPWATRAQAEAYATQADVEARIEEEVQTW